jgi:hypothetical protein
MKEVIQELKNGGTYITCRSQTVHWRRRIQTRRFPSPLHFRKDTSKTLANT